MRAWIQIALAFPLAGFAHDHSEPKDVQLGQAKPQQNFAARLTVRLVDEATGQELPGHVRIAEKGSDDWLDLSQQLLPRARSLKKEIQALGWHVVTGETEIAVSEKPLRIEAFSGIEYLQNTIETEASAQRVEIPLRRLFNPGKSGWIAGNTHLHLRQMTRELADRYLVEISRADGLEVVFVSYLERALVDRDYTTNGYTKDDLKRISTPDLLFGDGEEYRHNFGGGGEGYGHVMLLDLVERILPASVGPGITQGGTDGTPLQPGIEKARAGGATVIWCHNQFGREDLPNWLKGNVDAQNVFDGGSYGTYETTFYRYLDIGLKVPFSTGTDWFLYDFSRVYVRHRTKSLPSIQTWLTGLRSGETVITNGPWIEFQVNQLGPGESFDLGLTDQAMISASAAGRHDFGTLEVIRQGEVIASAEATPDPDGGFVAVIGDLQQLLDGATWLAARIQPKAGVTNELGQPLFAHTSPVYVNSGGKGVFRQEVADDIRAEMEESAEVIAKDGKFADDAEREAVLRVYREAIEELSKRK